MSPTNEPPRQPDTVHGVQYFTFENLPKEHWNKYRYAKRFVEVIQAQTPKVTVNEDAARCMMMENTPNPNYSVEFYDGINFIKSCYFKFTCMNCCRRELKYYCSSPH